MPRSGERGGVGERLICWAEGDLEVEHSARRDESENQALEHTSERVDGYQDTSDIRIDLSVLPPF